MRRSVVLMLASLAVLAAADTPVKTAKNLLAAYKGESNVHAKYIKFAQKADEEGYAGAARLFRAIAKAEKIHADSHQAVMKKSGEPPKIDIETTQPRSTLENLRAAFDGETWEHDEMYPPMITEASQEQAYAAAQSFIYARSAEGDHAKLYDAASKDIGAWKAADKDVFVCPVCGRTVLKIEETFCPVCSTPTEKYEKNPQG